MLLDDFSCEINELASHFSWETKNPCNFEVLDLSEFLFASLEHSLFKRSLETFEVIEMELVVASLGRVFLKDCGEYLICYFCGLIESFDGHILDWVVAISLQNALIEHRVGPSLLFTWLEDSNTSNLET